MAVISKIRNQSGLLIAVIGVAMGLFVLSDLLGTGAGLFQQQETNVAEIRGKKISFQEFEAKVQKEIGGENFDETAREQVRQRVWNVLLQEKIMFQEYEELGLSVSPEELYNSIKNTGPNSIMSQYFTNPQTGQIYEQFRDPRTGGLSSQNVINYVRQVLESDQAETWLPVERAIKLDRLSNKYYNLIKKGLNPSVLEINDELNSRNQKVSFNYVVKNYTSIADDQVEVKDADLKKFYNNHKEEERFTQKETSRGIEYIVFAVTPSQNDVNSLKEELSDLSSKFQASEDDTLFVNDYADTPFNVRFYKSGQLPLEIDSVAFNGPQDTVYGPIADAGSFKLIKVIGEKVTSDSVKARHILIQMQNPADSTKLKAKADSIKKAINGGVDFALVAATESADKPSAEKGGDLDWFTEGRMVKPFNDACFNGKVGDMPIVKTQFGYHIIEIQEKTKETRKVLAAIIDREIRPSKNTYDNVFNTASSFSINNNNYEAFKTAGAEYGIQTAGYIRENDKALGNLETPRPLIRWAYEASKGDVSEPFEMEDKFVVASLTNIREKGILPLDEIEDLIRVEVLNEKKAEFIKSQVTGKTDLNSIASTLGESVQLADNVSFSDYTIPGIGPEGAILGTLITLQPNHISEPIEGKRGVYIIQLNSLNQMQEAVAEVVTSDLNRGLQSRVDFETFNSLKENANIVDNRGKFY